MSKGHSGLFKGTSGSRTKPITPGGKASISTLSAANIRFSQTSVNGSKTIIDSMKKNGWVGEPIDVVTMKDGKITTIDNTRVVAARAAGIEVKARVHDYNEPIKNADMAARLSTKKSGTPVTWGQAVDYRIAKQNSAFRNNHTQGSFTMGKIN